MLISTVVGEINCAATLPTCKTYPCCKFSRKIYARPLVGNEPRVAGRLNKFIAARHADFPITGHVEWDRFCISLFSSHALSFVSEIRVGGWWIFEIGALLKENSFSDINRPRIDIIFIFYSAFINAWRFSFFISFVRKGRKQSGRYCNEVFMIYNRLFKVISE